MISLPRGLIALLSFCLLCGCSSSDIPPPTEFSGTKMTIDYRILIGKKLIPEESSLVENIIESTFKEIDLVYNKWNPDSELSKLNKLKANQKAPLSKELYHLLKISDALFELTEGRFDPSIEPLQQLWKDALKAGAVPESASLAKIKPAIGWKKIHFEEGGFWKEHDLASLDLGGIAKGYFADLLIERLGLAGFNDVYSEWGGEIRTSGSHPSGRPWTIFISRFGDLDPDHAIAIINLHNEAVATSGDYQQSWTILSPEGETISYFHILNPATGEFLQISPERVASATFTAPSCAFADALATAALFFDSEDAANAWADKIAMKIPSLRYWIISREKLNCK